jgi:cobalt-zinc-cadmium efflux system protein
MTIILSLTILGGTWSLMKTSMNHMLDAVPEGIDPGEVRAFLVKLPGVLEVHDLHIWPLSTTETALMAHLVMRGAPGDPSFLANACDALHARFHIEHATLQIDPHDSPPCRLAPDETL